MASHGKNGSHDRDHTPFKGELGVIKIIGNSTIR